MVLYELSNKRAIDAPGGSFKMGREENLFHAISKRDGGIAVINPEFDFLHYQLQHSSGITAENAKFAKNFSEQFCVLVRLYKNADAILIVKIDYTYLSTAVMKTGAIDGSRL